MADDDERARRERDDELRRAIEEASSRRPGSPREFTDRAARDAAAEERDRKGAEDADA
jgi:hypothetical protein